jgi:hypothetical protein
MRSLNRNGKEAEAQRQKRTIKQMEDDLKRFNRIVIDDMRRRPHDPELHYTLGRLLLRSGYHDEGLRWLNSALRLDPSYAPARKLLVEFYRKKKEGRRMTNDQ